jgi:hypothetical protein
MNIAHKSTFVLGGRHLLGIEGLSYSDIIGLLDLAKEFVELNRPFCQQSRVGPNDPQSHHENNCWTHALKS